jgi:hypothetical protein
VSYKKVVVMELSDIIRRIRDGQSISEISRVTGRDRKTIRKYITLIKQEVIYADEALASDILLSIVEKSRKPTDRQNIFAPYIDEIKTLLENKQNKLKLKSIYEVIIKKHDIKEVTSLSSFKRFLITHNLRRQTGITCRIEQKLAQEIQVDYGEAGRIINPLTGKKSVVYAFIGTLCSSRHKYAEFVFKQDQKSFVESHIKMFRFFGGVTKTITLDNLKAGVIKADLYDPRINRSYAEMGMHYDVFINPCRPGRPKDKGKVERDVQTIREEFKKMLAINPSITITEANHKIKQWLINEYGQRKHGTTQLKPLEFFKEVEQPCLLPLPEQEYEISEWKQVKVHPDCFIQINKKSYSVPYQYVGKALFVKVKSRIVEIYYNEELIKQHLIPKNNRQTDYDDFPENIQKALDGNLPAYLLREAERISGKNLRVLVEKILTPHAFINMRRAQGIISVAKNYSSKVVEEAAQICLEELTSYHPKEFKNIIIRLLAQEDETSFQLVISDNTLQFVRPINYFINNNE